MALTHNLRVRGQELAWSNCAVMGIANLNADSFSDGNFLSGNWEDTIQAQMDAGMSLLDVGAQSTRPGHVMAGPEAEVRMLRPAIASIREAFPKLLLSVDTQFPEVAEMALEMGAQIANDVGAASDPNHVALAASTGAGFIAMRREDCPSLAQLQDQFAQIEARCANLDGQLMLDPGLGFGDRPGADVALNLEFLRDAAGLTTAPVLIGHSRKRFVGAWSGMEVASERDGATSALGVEAAAAGAAMVRVHNVEMQVDALQDAGLFTRIRRVG